MSDHVAYKSCVVLVSASVESQALNSIVALCIDLVKVEVREGEEEEALNRFQGGAIASALIAAVEQSEDEGRLVRTSDPSVGTICEGIDVIEWDAVPVRHVNPVFLIELKTAAQVDLAKHWLPAEAVVPGGVRFVL